MTAELQLGSFSHAHCFNCNKTAKIDSFDWRKNVIASNDVGMELIQLVIICPVCRDEQCEGLFPNEMN